MNIKYQTYKTVEKNGKNINLLFVEEHNSPWIDVYCKREEDGLYIEFEGIEKDPILEYETEEGHFKAEVEEYLQRAFWTL